jgi:Zn-dependent protease
VTSQQFALAVLPVLLAITVHEVAHAWAAKLLGDSTAQRLGRLTLNPLKHVDLVGTVLAPAASFIALPFVFGWAKPVPVTCEDKYDAAIVAAAGPLANLLMAFGWAGVVALSPWELLHYAGAVGVNVNLSLTALNLLPIPPLDGGRIAAALLPDHFSWRLNRIEPYGFFILLALLATGALNFVGVYR